MCCHGVYDAHWYNDVVLYVQDKSSLPVRQFQFTGWPEESGKTPEHGADLIDLIGQVQKWQQTAGNRPVIVHCRCDTRKLLGY